MKKSSENLIDIINKKLSSISPDAEFSSSKIAQEILSEHPESELGINLQSLANMVFKIHTTEKSDDKVDDKVEFDDSERCRYEVKNDNYVWESKKAGKIQIPVSQIDEMFWDYSETGMDMSQNEVRLKYNLTIPQFNSIKATLWLYKKGHIYSPYTVEHTDPLDMNQMIANKMQEKFKNQDKVVKDIHSNELLKEYKKVIRRNAKTEVLKQEFFEELGSLLPSVEKVPVEKKSRLKKSKEFDYDTEELFVSVADLHIGARTEGLVNTRNYNSEELRCRLDKVAREANSQNAKNVTLAILGDLIESFSGMNHPDSWKSQEIDMYGAKIVVEAYNMLSEFFEKINNLNTIKIIGGNHDRASANKKEDNTPTIAAIIAFMLQEKYDGVYNIKYDGLVLTHDLGDSLRIIFAHGDNRILKKSNTSLDSKVIEFGDKDKFNLVLTGHWHSRQIQEDKKYLRWYSIPSIFSGNYYSERNGWNAQPGFFMVKVDDELKRPVIMDCPL